MSNTDTLEESERSVQTEAVGSDALAWNSWREYLGAETPLGFLLNDNRQFTTWKNDGSMQLLHLTGAKNEIRLSERIYPSPGGCLGASVYCSPLGKGGKLHNLSRFMIERQMPTTAGATKTIEPIVFEFQDDVQSTRQARVRELNYLHLGAQQWEAFNRVARTHSNGNEIYDIVAKRMKSMLSARVVQFLEGVLSCDGTPSNQQFWPMFFDVFDDFDFLGYAYFEIFTQYVSLHQQDDKSLELAQEGELNTLPYHEIAFKMNPSFMKKFRLRDFNPAIDELAQALEDHPSQSVSPRYSAAYFENFMMQGISNLLRSSLGLSAFFAASGQIDDPSRPPVGLTPALAGNLVHRLVRQPEWRRFHFLYEQERANIIWRTWDQDDVLFVSHGLIPKGEIGFRPGHRILPKVFDVDIDSNGCVRRGELLDVSVSTDILPFDRSLLRHHS